MTTGKCTYRWKGLYWKAFINAQRGSIPLPRSILSIILPEVRDMYAMTNHKFFDEDVEKVLDDAHPNVRELVLKECALLIHKDDVIALAKEFDLIVFNKESALE